MIIDGFDLNLPLSPEGKVIGENPWHTWDNWRDAPDIPARLVIHGSITHLSSGKVYKFELPCAPAYLDETPADEVARLCLSMFERPFLRELGISH